MSARTPEPEYLVICSEDVDWQTQVERVASFGRPMLLWGKTDADLAFVRDLMSKT
jgi:hypothetical protein